MKVFRKPAIAGASQRPEMRRRRNVSLAQRRSDNLHLAFGHGQAGNRHRCRIEPGLAVEPIKHLRGASDNGREHHIRRQLLGPHYDLAQALLRRRHGNVDFVDDFAAVGFDEIAHDAVQFTRIDVVGTCHKHPTPMVADEIFCERKAVLIWRCPGIDHVGRIFEALIERRIPQQSVAAFDRGQHSLALSRRTAAEDHGNAVIGQKTIGQTAIGLRVRFRIVGDYFDLSPRTPPAWLISWIASAVPRKCSVSVTAVSPVRENRTPTLHVSDRDAVLLTIVTPFTENSRMAKR